MTDLVERLLLGSYEARREAATALEAKDKELAVLRSLLDEWEDHTGPYLLDRAETAERERDQAIEALKPYVAATKHCPVTMKMCGVGEDHFRAARAITEED